MAPPAVPTPSPFIRVSFTCARLFHMQHVGRCVSSITTHLDVGCPQYDHLAARDITVPEGHPYPWSRRLGSSAGPRRRVKRGRAARRCVVHGPCDALIYGRWDWPAAAATRGVQTRSLCSSPQCHSLGSTLDSFTNLTSLSAHGSCNAARHGRTRLGCGQRSRRGIAARRVGHCPTPPFTAPFLPPAWANPHSREPL